jgi:serine/threonine-protein kinase
MAIEAGRVLNQRYRLIRPVGQGSQASVWVAEHLALQTHVAVKLIDPELAKKESARERFRREATAAAQLRSAHVVQILDHGIDGDQPFIVMELLDGEDLFERLAHRGRLSLRETSKIVTQVARALSRAHAAGIVHRDLKPENVFLCPNEDDEVVKVLDFGVAKVKDAARVTMQKTNVGTLIGTPHYMSPEQVKGIGEIDYHTDLWALGVIAFQCVTGELPFDSEGVGDLLIKISMGDIPVPSKVYPGVNTAFDTWFAKACERDPAKRFQSARELAVALNAVVNQIEGTVPRAPTVRPPAASLPAAKSTLPAPPRVPGGIAVQEEDDFLDEDFLDEDDDEPPTRMREPAPGAVPAAAPKVASPAPKVGPGPAAPRPNTAIGLAPPPRPGAPAAPRPQTAAAPAAAALEKAASTGGSVPGMDIVDFDETIPATDQHRLSNFEIPLVVRTNGPASGGAQPALAPLSEPPRAPSPPPPAPSRGTPPPAPSSRPALDVAPQAVIAPVMMAPPAPRVTTEPSPAPEAPAQRPPPSRGAPISNPFMDPAPEPAPPPRAPVRATTAPVEVEAPSTRLASTFTDPPPELDGSSKRRRMVRVLVAGLLIAAAGITWGVVRSQIDFGPAQSGTPTATASTTASAPPTTTAPPEPTTPPTTTASAIDPGKSRLPPKPTPTYRGPGGTPGTPGKAPRPRKPQLPGDGTIVVPDPPADDDSVPAAP